MHLVVVNCLNRLCGMIEIKGYIGVDWIGEIFRKQMGTAPNVYECFDLGIGGMGSMVFTNTDTILVFGENGKIWK